MPTQRIPEIEGIRGILSVLVVSGHVYSAPIPWYAGSMDFFFCISGFLITRILLDAPNLSADFLKTYAVRRALRIWPIYYVALLLYFGTGLLVFPHLDYQWRGQDLNWHFAWQPLILSLSFLQNTEAFFGLDRNAAPYLFGHSWSVAIEEQFYFLWPLLFLALRGMSTGFKRALIGTAAVVAVVSRGVGYVVFDSDAIYLCTLPSRLDSLVAGIVLAFLLNGAIDPERRKVFRNGFSMLAGVALVMLSPSIAVGYGAHWVPRMPALSRTIFDPTFGYSLLAFAALGLTILGTGQARFAFLRHPLLRRLGTISYSTYLLHVIVIVVVSLAMSQFEYSNIFVQWALSLAISIGVAHLSYNQIEARALALKHRFSYWDVPVKMDRGATE